MVDLFQQFIIESHSIAQLKRQRQNHRLILSSLATGNGKTIPQICEDWAATKATYRFLSNDRVEGHEILAGLFAQTSK